MDIAPPYPAYGAGASAIYALAANWSPREDLHLQVTVYKTVAVLLSHVGKWHAHRESNPNPLVQSEI